MISSNQINNFILCLRDYFFQIQYKYNPSSYHDVISYYMCGHCASFAQILFDIFPGICEYYANDSHVVVNIGHDYYDVRGCITDEVKKGGYSKVTPEEFEFLKMVMSKDEDFESEIQAEMVEVGLNLISMLNGKSQAR